MFAYPSLLHVALSMNASTGRSPFFWEWSKGENKKKPVDQMRGRVWTMLLPYVLLWPLISPRTSIRERSSKYIKDSAEGAQQKRQRHSKEKRVYVMHLETVHRSMSKHDRVEISPFNPLGSVRLCGQSQGPAGRIHSCFVPLQALVEDASQLEPWWVDEMKVFTHVFCNIMCPD